MPKRISSCDASSVLLPEGVVAAVETVLLAGVGELFFDKCPGFVLAEKICRFALGFGKGADGIEKIAGQAGNDTGLREQ